MSVVHIVTTKIAGAGTSYIASLVTQYLRSCHLLPYCADISDSAGFSHYSGLEVDYIDIYDPDTPFGLFNVRKIDTWVEKILARDRHCVLDVGASTFGQFFSYVDEADVFGLLKENGRRVIIHVPIIGDGRQKASVSCLKFMLERTQADIVVWHNEFHGPVDASHWINADVSLPQGAAARYLGVVEIERKRSCTFGRDVGDVITSGLTIEEALSRTEFGVMSRRRLSIVRQQMFEQLEAIPALSPSGQLLSALPFNKPLRLTQDRSFVKTKKR